MKLRIIAALFLVSLEAAFAAEAPIDERFYGILHKLETAVRSAGMDMGYGRTTEETMLNIRSAIAEGGEYLAGHAHMGEERGALEEALRSANHSYDMLRAIPKVREGKGHPAGEEEQAEQPEEEQAEQSEDEQAEQPEDEQAKQPIRHHGGYRENDLVYYSLSPGGPQTEMMSFDEYRRLLGAPALLLEAPKGAPKHRGPSEVRPHLRPHGGHPVYGFAARGGEHDEPAPAGGQIVAKQRKPRQARGAEAAGPAPHPLQEEALDEVLDWEKEALAGKGGQGIVAKQRKPRKAKKAAAAEPAPHPLQGRGLDEVVDREEEAPIRGEEVPVGAEEVPVGAGEVPAGVVGQEVEDQGEQGEGQGWGQLPFGEEPLDVGPPAGEVPQDQPYEQAAPEEE